MKKWRIVKGICAIPLVLSLLVCVISMFTGVSNGLFGISTIEYGSTAFTWALLYELTIFWWLYIACIIGIIIATVAIIKNHNLELHYNEKHT